MLEELARSPHGRIPATNSETALLNLILPFWGRQMGHFLKANLVIETEPKPEDVRLLEEFTSSIFPAREFKAPQEP